MCSNSCLYRLSTVTLSPEHRILTHGQYLYLAISCTFTVFFSTLESFPAFVTSLYFSARARYRNSLFKDIVRTYLKKKTKSELKFKFEGRGGGLRILPNVGGSWSTFLCPRTCSAPRFLPCILGSEAVLPSQQHCSDSSHFIQQLETQPARSTLQHLPLVLHQVKHTLKQVIALLQLPLVLQHLPLGLHQVKHTLKPVQHCTGNGFLLSSDKMDQNIFLKPRPYCYGLIG